MLNRREFVRSASFLGLGCGLAGCRCLIPGNMDYSVSVLGDLHYDQPPIDTFHSAFRIAHEKDGMFRQYRREFENFSSMWGRDGRSLGILQASVRCRTPETAFAVQLGDLVEGDCESSEAHARMFREMFALVKRTLGEDLPFITVAGNHDVRAGRHRQGEYENYRKISSAWHTKELGQKVESLNFAFRRGPDVWIVADFNRPDFAEIERLLLENRAARYTFFCSHGAVLTNGNRNSRCWFFAGYPQYSEKGGRLTGKALADVLPAWTAARLRIRRLLAERRAIVLSGHSHRLELRDWEGDGGRITELVVNSVTRNVDGSYNPGIPKVAGDRAEDFGRCRVSKKDLKAPNADISTMYADYVAGMCRYFTADAVGHVRLNVFDSGVTADYFALAETTPERTFRLR